MRKNVIALMLVLPLLFVFVVFSAVSTVSLGVHIAVTGIEIKGKPEAGTLYINLADYKEPYELDVGVKPDGATNTAYDFLVEEDGGSAFAEIEMVGNAIVPRSIGNARITAKSRDGAYRDSISVVVTSSAPYDFEFALFHSSDEAQGNNLISFDEKAGCYVAADRPLVTGTYTYRASLLPAGLTGLVFEVASGNENRVILDEAKGTVMFPFAGKVAFDITIPTCARDENRTKRVEFTVVSSDDAPILINGAAGEELKVGVIEEDASRRPQLSLYLQTAQNFSEVNISASPGETVSHVLTALGGGMYKVDLIFEDTGRPVMLTISAEDGRGERTEKQLRITFERFSFHVSAEGLKSRIEDGGEQLLLMDQSVLFSVVPDVEAGGMLYLWDVLDFSGAVLPPAQYADMLTIDPTNEGRSPDGNRCKVTATGFNSLVLRVRAAYLGEGGETVAYSDLPPVRITVRVAEEVSNIQLQRVTYDDAGTEMTIDKDFALNSLGRRLTLARNHYAGSSLTLAGTVYEIEIDARDQSRIDKNTGEPTRVLRPSDFKVRAVSAEDESQPSRLLPEGSVTIVGTVSEIGVVDGLRLRISLPRETGEREAICILVEWAAGESLGRDVSASFAFNLIGDGVLVKNSPQLFDAVDKQNAPVVLTADILLGTDERGAPLPLAQRAAMLKEMASTYNTQFYENIGTPESGKISYVLEFRFDVYGNGYALNAEYFTNSRDGTGQPELFRGPRDFVNLGGIASVAGQDNIAFLCRTDGVTIFNTVLLGCSDVSLLENGVSDLTKLNTVGTTLEVNADVNLLNCRVRNGRNVVRAYGGNRDGASYFVSDPRTITGIDENDRIHVRIEGCILSSGREFLLKLGANRALRAMQDRGLNIDNGVEPSLLTAAGGSYENPSSRHPEANEVLLADPAFCNRYVLTDVTLKDSVLETSGLFAIGVESNFSGEYLYNGEGESNGLLASWAGTGGTSFASVLRLVGDVRLYDWKDLSLIDSSTLIQVAENANFGGYDLSSFRLDVARMLEIVKSDPSGAYRDIYCEERDGAGNSVRYVHGGIAFYGGGRNYSLLDTSALNKELDDLHRYYINMRVLTSESDTSALAQLLPRAAGTQDFRFYLYDASSRNSFAKQVADGEGGMKYEGLKSVAAF